MQLIALGLDHERAPIEIRERVAIPAARIKEAIIGLCDYVSNGIVLSTCNRTEVYALEDDSSPCLAGMEKFLCEHSGVSPSDLMPRLFRERQEGAVRHLFRVASGLESLIVGEYEVLGQLRHVLVEAEGIKSVDPFLLGLLRDAVRVGRRVRSETAISRNAASVSSAAVEIARKIFPALSEARVLVIGAGQAGKVAVQSLVNSQVKQVLVMSRSVEHAEELANSLGGKALPYHKLKEALAETDIVISCTGSPHFVLEPSALADAVKLRNGIPMLLIDIAVPRDIDPAVKTLDNILLYDIDDLECVAKTNRRLRESEVSKVAEIVDEEASRFMATWKARQATPAITALLSKAEAIRAEQFEKTIKGMAGLSAEERAKLEAMSKSIVQKILHSPVSALKCNGGESKLVRDLFGLDMPE
ncbi:MAG: glutamyl-tRNA reductase [Dehalococcoidia bacterium]|nr:glutamyl-tRNA reductase [Dehalococcoidia bacterium]